jgi:protein-disulfide isomerase
MKKANIDPRWILLSILAAIIIILKLLSFISPSHEDVEKDNKSEQTSEVVKATPEELNKINDEETSIYQGKEDAPNEILFVFDYACPYCKSWEVTVFPQISGWIEEGTVKYRTQSMVFLSDISSKLADFDQNLKRNYPDLYPEINAKIMIDGHNEVDDWATNSYLEKLIKDYELNKNKMLATPKVDSISITRQYTKKFGIDAVPTVFVNGEKVKDPFDTNEIKSLMNN